VSIQHDYPLPARSASGATQAELPTPYDRGDRRLVRSNPRLKSLDGLRAVSVFLVVLSHVAIRLSATIDRPGASAGIGGMVLHQSLALFGLGTLGVWVFFVISGFLITSLLLREIDDTGRISLRRFYVRRTLRIFPAYYAYVALLFALTRLGYVRIAGANFWAALTYSSNYCFACAGVDRWYLAHTWSLAVEEQFYLIWPAVLVLFGRRRGLRAAAAAIAICPILRVIVQLRTGNADVGLQHFELVADALAMGCVFAGCRGWLHAKAWYMRVLDSPGFVAVPFGVVLAMELARHPRLFSPLLFNALGQTLVLAAIALIVDWSMTHSDSRIGEWLNRRTLVFVGTLSYSIYLWQMPFLEPTATDAFHRLPWSLGWIGIAAVVSYYLIERPFLRLRGTLARARRPARVNPTV
jgi:peptidoglycan/LPS O-acetylase OafA/YrhL